MFLGEYDQEDKVIRKQSRKIMSQLNNTYEGDEEMKITIALQNAKIANLESENALLNAKVGKMKKHIGHLKKKAVPSDVKTDVKIEAKTVPLEENPLFAPSCKMQ